MPTPEPRRIGIGPALQAKSDAAAAVLRAALAQHRRVVYASSLGAEAMVLTELICTQAPGIDIVSIDTGRLPEETLGLLEHIERRYARRIAVYYPDALGLQRYVAQQGVNGFYQGIAQRLACCEIRKLEPFRRAIRGYSAWVTGVRREQSATRAAALAVEHDAQFGLHKISPLLEWSEQDVWGFIRGHGLPYNPLHDRGYASIGCAPCTRPVGPGQEQRAGRWWWEQPESRECGLHPRHPERAANGEAV